MKKLMLAILTSLAMAGCASVPMGDPARDTELKAFAPPAADKAGLYVYRNEFLGAAVAMPVELDGKPLGKTQGKTYLYKEISPGHHTLSSTTENNASLEFDAQAGSNVYVWQEAKMGMWMARSKLHLVSEAEGQKGVKECKLAVTE